MKKTKFKNIHSLEDIREVRLQLKKKVKLTEKSISEKTDLGKILIGALGNKGGTSGDKESYLEALGYLLPAGLKYIIKILKKNTGKKQFKRLLIYSAIGGAIALSVYQVLGKGQSTESKDEK